MKQKPNKFKNIYLFAGHGAGDPGATFGNTTEAELNKELRDLVAEKCKVKVIKDNDNLSTAKLLRSIGWVDDDLIIDIHFNAGPPTATGTEVFYPTRHTDLEVRIAKELSNLIAIALNVKDRGAKSETQTARGKIGILNVKGTNVLIEVCFMTNVGDMLKYRNFKNEVARVIAFIIETYSI